MMGILELACILVNRKLRLVLTSYHIICLLQILKVTNISNSIWLLKSTVYKHGKNYDWLQDTWRGFDSCQKRHKHPLYVSQPAVSLPAVPWQRILTVEIFKLHAFRSSLHILPCRTDSQVFFFLAYIIKNLLPNNVCLPNRCPEMVAVYRVAA
jgi:hypothetical protein